LQADKRFLEIVVAEAVAIVDLCLWLVRGEFQMIRAYFVHPPDGLPRIFRCIKGADIFFATLDEVIGEFAVEILIRVWPKTEGAVAAGATSQLRALFEDLVEQQAVVCCNVFNVGHVFVTAFNLEAANACVDECA